MARVPPLPADVEESFRPAWEHMLTASDPLTTVLRALAPMERKHDRRCQLLLSFGLPKPASALESEGACVKLNELAREALRVFHAANEQRHAAALLAATERKTSSLSVASADEEEESPTHTAVEPTVTHPVTYIQREEPATGDFDAHAPSPALADAKHHGQRPSVARTARDLHSSELRLWQGAVPVYEGRPHFPAFLQLFEAKIGEVFSARILKESALWFTLLQGRLAASIRTELTANGVFDGADVLAFLSQRYRAKDVDPLLRQLDGLVQRRGVTILKFAKEFRSILSELQAQGVSRTEEEQMLSFRSKLRAEIRLHLHARTFRSLQQLIDAAAALERELDATDHTRARGTTAYAYGGRPGRKKQQQSKRRPVCADPKCIDVLTNECKKFHPRCAKRDQCTDPECRKWHTRAERAALAKLAGHGSSSAVFNAAFASFSDQMCKLFFGGNRIPLRAMRDEGTSHPLITKAAARKIGLRELAWEPAELDLFVVNHSITLTSCVELCIDDIREKFYLADSIAPGVDMLLPKRLYMQLPGIAPHAHATVADQSEATVKEEELRKWANDALLEVQEATARKPMKAPALRLETIDHEPIRAPPRFYSPTHSEAGDEFVKKALDMDWIEEEPADVSPQSRYSTNLHPVRKADGKSWRMTHDTSPLNPVIIRKGAYPLPTLETILRRLDDSYAYMSEIDCSDAYFKVLLDERSRNMTAFPWRGKRYRWKRMPQGLWIAPDAYQRRQDDIIGVLTSPGSTIFVYFDNIFVASQTLDAHRMALRLLFDTMKEHNLTPNAKKSQLVRTELDFLVFRLTRGTFRIASKLQRAIKNAQPQRNRKWLQSFIGLANLTRLYHPEVARHLRVLQDAVNAKGALQWTPDVQNAFEKLRDELAKPSMLAYWGGSGPVDVYTDASTQAISCVIVDRETKKPLAFWSKVVRNQWTIQRRELFAVRMALKRFAPLLAHRSLRVFVDNRNLEHLLNKTATQVEAAELSDTEMRWLNDIHYFDLSASRVATDANPSDFLSRFMPDEADDTLCDMGEDDDITFARITTALMAHEGDDPNGDHEDDDDDDDDFDDADADEVQRHALSPLREELVDEDNEDVKADARDDLHAEVTAAPFTFAELIEAQKDDLAIQLNDDKRFKQYGDLIVFAAPNKPPVPVLPHGLLQRVLDWLHRDCIGADAMAKTAEPLFFYPAFRRIAKAYCNRSASYQRVTTYTHHGEHRTSAIRVQFPNDLWCMDYFHFKGNSVLNVVDGASSFTMARETGTQTADDTISVLRTLFALRGVPKAILSDNGPHFKNDAVSTFLKRHRVTQVFSIPEHPATNGKVERNNAVLKKILSSGLSLTDARALANFRPRHHGRRSPAEMFGIRTLPLNWNDLQEVDWEEIEQLEEKYRLRMEDNMERNRRDPPTIEVNQAVYVRNSRPGAQTKYNGPFRVVRVLENALTIDTPHGHRRVHLSNVKPGHAAPQALELDDDQEEDRDNTADEANAHERFYEIERLSGHRTRNGVLEFRVHWVGYRRPNWIPVTELNGLTVSEYFMNLE